MTDPLQLFPSRVAIGWYGQGQDRKPIYASEEFLRALGKIFQRVGGATGPSTTDLNVSDDEDSGLEEFRHEQFKQNDAFAMAPPAVFLAPEDPLHPIQQQHVSYEAVLTEMSGLRAEVAVLRTLINDIQQGSLL